MAVTEAKKKILREMIEWSVNGVIVAGTSLFITIFVGNHIEYLLSVWLPWLPLPPFPLVVLVLLMLWFYFCMLRTIDMLVRLE